MKVLTYIERACKNKFTIIVNDNLIVTMTTNLIDNE